MPRSSVQPSVSAGYSSRTIPEIVRRCTVLANLHQTGGLGKTAAETLKEISRVLALVCNVQATLAAEALPEDLEINTSLEHPGYVFISQGIDSYAVPFFLVDMFPGRALLTELKELSKKARISSESIICLSGSSCSLGLGIPIADLDFCEYLKGIDSTVSEGLIGATRLKPDRLACIKVTVSAKSRWSRPWTQDLLRPTKTFVDQTTRRLKASTHRKVDYVGNTESLGVLEVTNKLLSIDFAYAEVGEARGSFSHQEVPFDGGSWVPRQLSDPLELGRYVLWLQTEIHEKLLKSVDTPRLAVKALRRALPLARILLASKELKVIQRLLMDDNGARLSALHDRCQLFTALSNIEDPSLDSFREDLKKSIGKLRKVVVDNGSSFGSLTESENEQLDIFAVNVRVTLSGILGDLTSKISLA